MAKRYKLIPESLYKRFLQPDDQPIKTKPEAVLRQAIPDDLKVLLYADAARDVHVKQQRKRAAPIYVKPVEEPSRKLREDRMPRILNNAKALAIHEYLKSHGVTYNDDMEIVINGKTMVHSVYPMMIKGLQNKNFGYQVGMNEVLDALPGLPPGVSKTLAKMQKVKDAAKQTGSGFSKTVSSFKHFKTMPRMQNKRKQYGSGWVSLR